MARRAAKIDSNQPEIVSAFRGYGFKVHCTHMVGDGFPDLAVARNGWMGLVEVKDGTKPPSARKLTPDEQKFHDTWPCDVHIIESVDDVTRLYQQLIYG